MKNRVHNLGLRILTIVKSGNRHLRMELKLSAIYLPRTDSHKTAIVAHGYMGNAETMANYAKMFHDLGYNVLVPDARGHGKSEGDYIGFGWHERKDYVKWIDQVLETNGQSEEIVLYGISMGARR